MDATTAIKDPAESVIPLLLEFGFAPETKTLDVTARPSHPGQAKVRSTMKRFNVASCGRRFGKALALDTKIPVPTGWTTMGEIKEGDWVLDAQGRRTRVMFTSPVYTDHECYRVVFSDGTEVIADGGHRWKTWTKCERKNSRRNLSGTRRSAAYSPKVRTTAEIAASLRDGKERNHSVETCSPLELPTAILPLSPYTLGAWLGDGTSTRAEICGVDEEVFQNIRDEGYQCRCTNLNSNGVPVYQIGEKIGRRVSLNAVLGELELLGNKHIPPVCLRASFEQRLALLQGLMDTDGHCEASGACRFTTVNARLADDVLELVRTFGIKATRLTGSPTSRKAGEKNYYIVCFSTDLPVFRLKRKLVQQTARRHTKRLTHRFIQSCDRIEPVPVKCIWVDNPESLYLCSESFIPTHNTFMCEDWLIEPAVKDGLPVAWFAPTFKMLTEVFDDIVRLLGEDNIVTKNRQQGRIVLKNGGKIDFWSLEASPTLRGRKYARIVVDEAAHVTCDLQDAWEKVIRPTLTDYVGDAFFISTPNGFNFFRTLYERGEDPKYADWMCWQLPTTDNPFIDPSEVAAAKEEMDDQSFRQEYLAEFLRDEGKVFRNVEANLIALENATPGQHTGHKIVAGVDWAQIKDFTCNSIGCETCRVELFIERFNQIDFATQRRKLVEQWIRWNVSKVRVEENSIGRPNYEELIREAIVTANGGDCHVTAERLTSESKPRIIQNLQLSLEKQQFKFLPDRVGKNEFLSYEAKVNASTGRIRYSAPSGGHDDTVIARGMMLLNVVSGGNATFIPFRLR